MDETRILAALREGPIDEPRYRPLGRRLVDAPDARPGRPRPIHLDAPRPRPILRGASTLAFGAVVLLVAAILLRPAVAPPVAATPSPSPSATPSGGPSPSRAPQTAFPASQPPDALARIRSSGVLRVLLASPAPAIPPARLAYQQAVASELASRLGLTIEFSSVPAEQMLTDSADASWDLGAVQFSLSGVLGHGGAIGGRFAPTDPYLYVEHRVLVRRAGGARSFDGLAGARMCVVDQLNGATWLDGRLRIDTPAAIASPPAGVQILQGDSDTGCEAAVRDGTADALLTSALSPAELDRIGSGTGDLEDLGVAFVESISLIAPAHLVPRDVATLRAAVDGAVADMRADGTLSRLSKDAFGGEDLSVLPVTP